MVRSQPVLPVSPRLPNDCVRGLSPPHPQAGGLELRREVRRPLLRQRQLLCTCETEGKAGGRMFVGVSLKATALEPSLGHFNCSVPAGTRNREPAHPRRLAPAEVAGPKDPSPTSSVRSSTEAVRPRMTPSRCATCEGWKQHLGTLPTDARARESTRPRRYGAHDTHSQATYRSPAPARPWCGPRPEETYSEWVRGTTSRRAPAEEGARTCSSFTRSSCSSGITS
jgi:hypothetical protein